MDKLAKIYEDTKDLVQNRNKLNRFMNSSVETLLPSFTRKDKVQLNTLLDSWILTHLTSPTRTPYNGIPEIVGIFEQDLKNKGFIVTEKKLHLLVKLLLISYIKNQTPESAILEDVRKDSLRQLFIAQTQEQAAQQPTAAQELSAQELSAQAELESLQQAIKQARELEAQQQAAQQQAAQQLAAQQLAARELAARELAGTNVEPRQFLQQYQAARVLARDLSKKKQAQSQLQFLAAREAQQQAARELAATNLEPKQTLRQYQEAREQAARDLSLRRQAQSKLKFQAAQELLAREAQYNNDEAEIRGRQKNPYSKKTRDRSRDGDSELGDLSSREIDDILEYGYQPHSSVARASDHPDMYTGLPQSAYQYPDSSAEFNADLVDDKGDPDFDAYYGNESLGGKLKSRRLRKYVSRKRKRNQGKKKTIKRQKRIRKSKKHG